jgi:hypothetical protein
MLALFCVDFDGMIRITDYDSCAERSEFVASLDRSEFRDVIEVNGSFDFLE